jgi:hypothetical protein
MGGRKRGKEKGKRKERIAQNNKTKKRPLKH